ncbi:MAG: signal peptide peptidase SppA [Opitutales bacterium]
MKSFFETIFKAVFSACIVNFIILILISSVLVSFLGNDGDSKKVELKKGSTLYVDTSMLLSDIALGARNDIVVAGNAKMSLLELYKRITSAAYDPNIDAIFICNAKARFGFNLSQALAIKKALTTFKESGKKVYSYLGEPTISQNEYFLATIADKLYLNPYSILDFSGISFQGVFFGNAFDKYGIEASVVKCGVNKSFGDMFTSDKFSPETKADLEEIARGLEDYTSGSSGNSRGIEKAKLEEIRETTPLVNAKEAKGLNLVDEIAYKDEVYKILGKGDDKFNLINVKSYVPNYRINKEKAKSNIAVVYMTGDIVEFGTGDNVISAQRYCKIIGKIREDNSVKSVVFVINSGGGSAYASEQIRRAVEVLGKEKKCIAYVTSMCASGAYWIASSCEKIYTQETSIVGSIGVFSLLFDIEKISGNFGITYDVAKSSKYADLFTSTRKPSEAEIAIMQSQVDDIYDNFVNLVATSRNLDADFVRKDIATGSVWTSQKAKALGLIDSDDNNLPDTLQSIAKELKLEGTNYGILTYPTPKTYEEFFFELITGESSTDIKSFLPKIIKDNAADKIISTFDDSSNLYLRTPFILKEF